ncbi:MAG: response regulator transcription factor [Hydrogenophaga sp.]|nr:DNA-binding response regulator [Comamonadaceae bacterium]MBS4037043.1 response regulator transcription factor [Hydrogenophaga sp.]
MNILIVEDDDRIADFLCRGLRAEGHRVQRAADGPTGLALARDAAREQHPQEGATVLVLDLMLPGLSGLEICQALRSAQVGLPILMLTAQGSLEDRVNGLRLGADDYLCKPFDFEELLARLEALARRGREWRPAAPARLCVGDLELDRDRMQASRGGQVLPLTARELALLELLMSAPGRLFSRERILANVWGTSEDPLTNVVDVYIRRLRARIDREGAPALIHTVRGLGYRLEVPPASQG